MKRIALFLVTISAGPVMAQSGTTQMSNPATSPRDAASSTNVGVAGAKGAWNTMTSYVTAAAEQISEADYAFKPVATVRTFGELIGHIAGAQNMMCAAALGEKVPGEDEIEKSVKTKAGLVAALKASTAYCARAYALDDAAAAGGTKLFGQDFTKMGVLALNAAHNAEHYGNIVTYMRIKGMVPPSSQPRSGQ